MQREHSQKHPKVDKTRLGFTLYFTFGFLPGIQHISMGFESQRCLLQHALEHLRFRCSWPAVSAQSTCGRPLHLVFSDHCPQRAPPARSAGTHSPLSELFPDSESAQPGSSSTSLVLFSVSFEPAPSVFFSPRIWCTSWQTGSGGCTRMAGTVRAGGWTDTTTIPSSPTTTYVPPPQPPLHSPRLQGVAEILTPTHCIC